MLHLKKKEPDKIRMTQKEIQNRRGAKQGNKKNKHGIE